jgi:hypothetical protein
MIVEFSPVSPMKNRRGYWNLPQPFVNMGKLSLGAYLSGVQRGNMG